MKIQSLIIIAGLSLASAFAANQKPELATTPYKVIPVAGTVSLLQGPGGNIAVCAGADGLVMVDDGYAGSAAQIQLALRRISDQPLRFVVNTHLHDDHVGANAFFQKQAPVIAQSNVRRRLAAGTNVLGRAVPPEAAGALPQVTFDDAVTLHLNGEEIRVIHLPAAHTDGDSVVYFVHANVLHMGDLFVTYGFPFIDLDNGGHVKGMIAAIDKVLTLVPADVKVLPGHGDVCTVADMKAFAAMLQETSARVAAGIAQGKTVQQLQQEKVLAGFEKWTGGFLSANKIIEFLYRDLSAPVQSGT